MLKIASVGSGLPLVFIHGWGLNSGVWQPCVEKLKKHYQVITVDLPGFGINVDADISPYSLENIAQIIQKSIQQTIGRSAVYIGWSLGGLVATEIARSNPQSTLALVTIASSPCFIEQENWPGIPANVLALFHRQLEQDTRKTIENFLKIQAMGSPHVRQDIKEIRDLVMQYQMPSKATLDNSLKFIEQADQRFYLSHIKLPFLRTYGRLDGLVPKKVISQIDALAPDSAKYIFEQASHAPFISEHETFIRILTSWLSENVNG